MWVGYMFNGWLMEWFLEKLISVVNFGENGVINKLILINYDFVVLNLIIE